MASLKLVNKDNVKYLDVRDRLYFNKYVYKISCEILGAKYLYKNHDIASWERKIRNLSHGSLYYLNLKHKKQKPEQIIDLLLKNKPNIERYVTFCKKYKNKIQIRVESKVSIFTNDLSILDEINAFVYDYEVYKATVFKADGVKYFIKEPKYKYRTYFRSKPIKYEEKLELAKYFLNNDDIKCSYSLTSNLERSGRYCYLFSHYYIDYNDPQLSTYLRLAYGDYLGLTYVCEQIKNSQLSLDTITEEI